MCTKFGGYNQWTANLARASPPLSLGRVVEGLNVANKMVFSECLAGPFLG